MIAYDKLPEKPPVNGVMVALGIFDGLHRGHLAVLGSLLSEEKAMPRCVFTFSTSSAKPDSKTGEYLLEREAQDAMLEAMGFDYVFRPEFSEFRDMSPEKFVKDFLIGYLNARLVFCGENFRFGKNAAAGVKELEALLDGSAVLRAVPVVCDGDGAISTTRIRELIKAGDVQSAEKLLGRAFAIDFTVIHGKKLGRRLNWPTINQRLPDGFVIPKFGVYASIVSIDGKRHASVTNIGVKPTFGGGEILAETYIHGFSGDLYGERIPVELKKYIRGERKFENAGELKAQIEKDNDEAMNVIGGI